MADEQFRNLSPNDMATYFERSFENQDVQRFLNASDSLDGMCSRYRTIGHFISAYATSTGDLSQASVSKIIEGMKKHPGEYTNTVFASDFMKEVLGPMIVKQHCQKLGISYPVNIEDTQRLLFSVYMQSYNNQFETHSFNGALLDDVRENGLDIHREKFRGEFEALDRAGLHQPYQTGKLMYCELNGATFGYALRAPERLIRSLEDARRQQGKTQSNRDYCLECLDEYVSQKGISGPNEETIRKAAQTIVDFYFRPDGNKSAIAIKKASSSGYKPDFDTWKTYFDAWKIFSYYEPKRDVERFCQKNGDTQSLQSFKKALSEFNQIKKHDKLSLFVQEFNKKYPTDNPILKHHQEFLYSQLQGCLKNFNSVVADGHVVPGGRLSPQEFSLAVLDNPIDNYVAHQKQLLAQPQRMFGLLLGPDGKNYWARIGEDGKLIIPDSLKEKYPDPKPVSNHDLLRDAANGGQGQGGEPPMDDHNAIDYRDVGGKDRKPEIPTPDRPIKSQEDDAVRKRAEEIRRQLGWDNQLAAKRGNSL